MNQNKIRLVCYKKPRTLERARNIILSNTLHFPVGSSGIRDLCKYYFHKSTHIVLAFNEFEPVGCCTRKTYGVYDDKFEVSTFVKKEFRRKGIGTLMIRKMEKVTKEPITLSQVYYNGVTPVKFYDKVLNVQTPNS